MVFLFQKLNLIYGAIFSALAIALYFFPDLDLAASRIFYEEDQGFIYAHHPIIIGIFNIVHPLCVGFALCLLCYAIYFYKHKNLKKSLLYFALFFSLLCSAGLIVNVILKENFARARPKEIREFNGEKKFSKAFIISNQCQTNCSFSSGHAAAGFTLASIAIVFANPYAQIIIYNLGILFGIIVGIGRLMQGGHFLSDVLSSGAIVSLINFVFMLQYYKIIKSYKL